MIFFRRIMYASFAIFMLLMLSTPMYSMDTSRETTEVEVSMTTVWKEFEDLKVLEGRAYLDARDKLLAMQDIEGRLRPYLSSGNWRDYFQAKVLLGWLRYGDFYREFLLELNKDDLREEVKRLRPTAVGFSSIYGRYQLNAERNYKEKINPLCLEHILKNNNYDDDELWHYAIFIRMLYATPDKADIDSAISLLISTNDEQIKGVMLDYLAYMPHKIILPKLDNLIQELEVFIEQRSEGYREKDRQQYMLLGLKYTIEDKALEDSALKN